MNKKILFISIIITGILVVGATVNRVDALEISYPIAELDSCADKTACKTYCDKSENIDACLSFAEKNKLMSSEEIKVAKNFKGKGMTGPGGCKGKDECSAYCNGPDHMDACIAFAEKNGMMSSDQLQEAKKVQGAISRGIKPPACGGKDACNSYCSSSEHMAECVGFAEAAGIISKEKADKIKSGGPGGKDGSKQGPDGGKQGPEGQGPGGGEKGPGGPDGQGNGKQRPPKGQKQGQGQGGQDGQNNGGPGPKNQQQGQGPGGQDQNQGGSENGGQPPTTN